MFHVTDRDIKIGQGSIDIIFNIQCPFALPLFVQSENEEEEIAKEERDGCVFRIREQINQEAVLIYEGTCLVRKLRDGFAESPYFLQAYSKIAKGIYEKNQGYKGIEEELSFLCFSIYELGVLFSANNQRVPWISKEDIRELFHSFRTSTQDFMAETNEQIKQVSPEWWRILNKIKENTHLNGIIWNMSLFIFRLFLEGTKPIENLTEEDFGKIEDYLARQHRGR